MDIAPPKAFEEVEEKAEPREIELVESWEPSFEDLNSVESSLELEGYERMLVKVTQNQIESYENPFISETLVSAALGLGADYDPELMASIAGSMDLMVHASLIKDDFQDRDILRGEGNFAVWHSLQDYLSDAGITKESYTDPGGKIDDWTDELIDTLAGGLIEISRRDIAKSNVNPKEELQLRNIYSEVVENLYHGQGRDNILEMEISNPAGARDKVLGSSSDENDYEDMAQLKTGALYSGLARMGGVLSGAEEEDLNHLSTWGVYTGTLLQIANDLEDMKEDQEEDKFNALSAHMDPKLRAEMSGELTEEEFTDLISNAQQENVFTQIRENVQDYAEMSYSTLDSLDFENPEYEEVLQGITMNTVDQIEEYLENPYSLIAS